MLRLPEHWVWDSWYTTDDDGRHHAFFLHAPKALGDPERRHRNASIGHAVSTDLRTWQRVADALAPADAPAWDDVATWTGSVVRGPDRRWYLFYTGVTDGGDRLVQRIGLAVSDDLLTWRRHDTEPLLEPDPAWYETHDTADWAGEAWRDPWVFPDPEGGWHMLITAHAKAGDVLDRGVIGHAYSPDLLDWEVRPPLTRPAGFGHLEVPQVAVVDGQPLLLFCSNLTARPGTGPIRVVPGPSVTGPWDLSRAQEVDCPGLYAPRLVRDSAGAWQLIGFLDGDEFTGELSDPIPVRYTAADGLTHFPANRRLLVSERATSYSH